MINVEKKPVFHLKLKVRTIYHFQSDFNNIIITIGTASENSRTFIFGDEDHTLGNKPDLYFIK